MSFRPERSSQRPAKERIPPRTTRGRLIAYDAGGADPSKRTAEQRAVAVALEARRGDPQGKGGRFEANAAGVVSDRDSKVGSALSQATGNHAEVQALIDLLIKHGHKPSGGKKLEGKEAHDFILSPKAVEILKRLGKLTLFTERAPCKKEDRDCENFLNKLGASGVTISVRYAIPISHATQQEDITLGMVLPQAMDTLRGGPSPPLLARCINGSIPAHARASKEEFYRPGLIQFYKESPFDYVAEVGLRGCRMLLSLGQDTIAVRIPEKLKTPSTRFPPSHGFPDGQPKNYDLNVAQAINLEKNKRRIYTAVSKILEGYTVPEVPGINIAKSFYDNLTPLLANNLPLLRSKPLEAAQRAINEVIKGIPADEKFNEVREFFEKNKDSLSKQIVAQLGPTPTATVSQAGKNQGGSGSEKDREKKISLDRDDEGEDESYSENSSSSSSSSSLSSSNPVPAKQTKTPTTTSSRVPVGYESEEDDKINSELEGNEGENKKNRDRVKGDQSYQLTVKASIQSAADEQEQRDIAKATVRSQAGDTPLQLTPEERKMRFAAMREAEDARRAMAAKPESFQGQSTSVPDLKKTSEASEALARRAQAEVGEKVSGGALSGPTGRTRPSAVSLQSQSEENKARAERYVKMLGWMKVAPYLEPPRSLKVESRHTELEDFLPVMDVIDSIELNLRPHIVLEIDRNHPSRGHLVLFCPTEASKNKVEEILTDQRLLPRPSYKRGG